MSDANNNNIKNKSCPMATTTTKTIKQIYDGNKDNHYNNINNCPMATRTMTIKINDKYTMTANNNSNNNYNTKNDRWQQQQQK